MQFWDDDGVSGRDECYSNLLDIIEATYPEDEGRQQKARQQFASYKAKEGMFGHKAAISDAQHMPAWQWWETYGVGAPELQRVAKRILSQVSSSSACERCWSVYDFIHSARRNRLAPERAEKLVRIYMNLRLAEDAGSVTSEERFMEWVEGSVE